MRTQPFLNLFGHEFRTVIRPGVRRHSTNREQSPTRGHSYNNIIEWPHHSQAG